MDSFTMEQLIIYIPSYYSNPKGRIKFITKNQYKNIILSNVKN